MNLCNCSFGGKNHAIINCPIHGLADLLLPAIDAAAPVPSSPQSLPAPSLPEPAKARLAKGPDGQPLSPIMFEFCVDNPPPPPPAEPGQAKRNPVDFDYTVLYRPFLHAMAQIGHYGASKYGHGNWKLSPLVHDKSPQNHLEGHLTELAEGRPHDHFHTLRHQIAAIGFNAMMMFYWMEREELEGQELEGGQGQGRGVSVEDLRGAR